MTNIQDFISVSPKKSDAFTSKKRNVGYNSSSLMKKIAS